VNWHCRGGPRVYQVIARKYRPQTFADVVGQEHVTDTLDNAIKQNASRTPTSSAARAARARRPSPASSPRPQLHRRPEGGLRRQRSAVKEITDGRAMDVLEIDGASQQRRRAGARVARDVPIRPGLSGKFKIYIIDEVHMLSTAAFNALLKTLEEPPAHVKFMFATTDPEKVLPTILSRCQRFDLKPIPTDLIVAEISEPDVLDVYGLVAAEKIAALAAALAAGDHQKTGRDRGRLRCGGARPLPPARRRAGARARRAARCHREGRPQRRARRRGDDDRAAHADARRAARGRGA
jgi:DNA polymerase-3 subunit gamma/tau